MCGIALSIAKDRKSNALAKAKDLVNNQIGRGKQGFGILITDEEKQVKILRSTELTEFYLDLKFNLSPFALVHHRTPTSSDNHLEQTHPIIIDHESFKHRYYFVHNGIISNDEDRWKELSKAGFNFSTESELGCKEGYVKWNDSEALGIDLARLLEKQVKTIESKGSAAFIMLQVNKKTGQIDNIFFGRNSNPLILNNGEEFFCLSSEGNGQPIETNKIFQVEPKNKFKIKEWGTLPIEEYRYISSAAAGFDVDRGVWCSKCYRYHYKKEICPNASNTITDISQKDPGKNENQLAIAAAKNDYVSEELEAGRTPQLIKDETVDDWELFRQLNRHQNRCEDLLDEFFNSFDTVETDVAESMATSAIRDIFEELKKAISLKSQSELAQALIDDHDNAAEIEATQEELEASLPTSRSQD